MVFLLKRRRTDRTTDGKRTAAFLIFENGTQSPLINFDFNLAIPAFD